MLNFFRNKSFVKNNQVLGVHCSVQPGGDKIYYVVIVTRKNGKLSIEKSLTIKGGVENIASEVPLNIPVYLSVDGKGVLNKKIMVAPDKSAIQQVIPNAVEEEFVAQQCLGTESVAFVSIARKSFVDELINDFIQQKLPVIGLTVGPFIVAHLSGIFEHFPIEFLSGSYLISSSSAGIIDFRRLEGHIIEERYNIGDQVVSSEFLLPFYQAITYYIQADDELLYPLVVEQYEEFTSKRIFMLTSWSTLVLVFLILLVNMLYFSKFSGERKILESQMIGNNELLAKLKVLKEELEWKEKFLNQTGILNNARMSYYADQIAGKIPEEIILERMDIHPLLSKIKKQREIEFQPNRIVIEGIATNSIILNDWINSLSKLTWTKEVNIVTYSKEGNSEMGNFLLEINIKETK